MAGGRATGRPLTKAPPMAAKADADVGSVAAAGDAGAADADPGTVAPAGDAGSADADPNPAAAAGDVGRWLRGQGPSGDRVAAAEHRPADGQSLQV